MTEFEEPSGSNFLRLKAHIIELSRAKTWHAAVLEWDPVDVDESETECPCGQKPIVERCWIANRETDRETFVGNVCIKKFMRSNEGLQTLLLVHAGVDRIRRDLSAAANEALVRFLRERGKLKPDTFEFLMRTRRKRKLSSGEMRFRYFCNRRILRAMSQAAKDRKWEGEA